MKKAVTFIICSITFGILMIIFLFLNIVSFPKDVFRENYTNVLSTKYETLINTDSPKIIIVSGSSTAFSLDGNMLAEKTGMNVVNMGIHAGIGALYETELSKANIKEGDIVLLGYEWGWVTDEDYMDAFGTDLIMVGIDEKTEMYRYVPFRKYKDVLGYLFTFADKKRIYDGEEEAEPYSSAAFSENGNTMEFYRDDSPIIAGYEENPSNYGSVDFEDPVIPESTVKYLKKYKKYVESKGASVYWIGCPTYEAAVLCDHSELRKAAKQVEDQIGIPYISDPADYVFPGKYMYDTLYHTTSRGMVYRTEILVDDLREAGIIPD